MSKRIVSEKELNKKIEAGVDKLADLIGATMSSQGKGVLLEHIVTDNEGRERRFYQMTKDGITVAKAYQDEDPAVNLAIQVLVGAGISTNELVDDGTSTTINLGRAIYKNGRRLMKKNTNVNLFAQGVDKAVVDVTEYLTKGSKEIQSHHDKLGLAAASCVDPKLANFVVEVIDKAGESDIVFRYTPKVELRYEIEPAFVVKSGFQNTTIVMPKKTPINNPYILIFPRMVSDGSHLMEFLRNVVVPLNIPRGGGIIIFSQDIIGACNQITRQFFEDTGILILVVKTPTERDRSWPDNSFMQDLAAFSGAKVTDYDLNQVKIDDLAQVERVLIDKQETTITNPTSERVEKYLEGLDQHEDEEKEEDKKEIIRERKRRLTGKIVAIYHKAATDAETSEIKDRLDDAIPTLRNALKEGAVVGGGIALLNARDALSVPQGLSQDGKLGFRAVIDSLDAPAIQIIKNTGTPPKKILAKIGGRIGYNVNTSEITDFVREGILDATNVTYTALRSGASAAKTLLKLAGAILINEGKNGR